MPKSVQKSFVLAFMLITVTLFNTSCKNTKAVCPGAGQSSASDFNPFNSEGQPKSGKKKKSDNGLVDKKQPKKLNKR